MPELGVSELGWFGLGWFGLGSCGRAASQAAWKSSRKLSHAPRFRDRSSRSRAEQTDRDDEEDARRAESRNLEPATVRGRTYVCHA